MNCLVVTNLFPNMNDPNRGLFVKQEIQCLSKLCNIKVIAPVPWFPPIKLNSRWHRLSFIEPTEIIDEIEVHHPRYLVIPKTGRSLYGLFYFFSIYQIICKIKKKYSIDIIYVHYAYPDGFGVALVSKILKIPFILKVRGSDINLFSKPLLRRKMIQYALRQSSKVIAVSKALNDRVIELETPSDKIKTIHNGVDNKLFYPIEKAVARKSLNITDAKTLILFVGHLVPIKGIHILLESFSMLLKENNHVHLIIIGEGSEKKSLMNHCKLSGLDAALRFVGEQPHDKLPLWFNACDVFCLPSLMEGYPNVILESLACGTPVVASRVGGIPEVLTSPELGILTEPGNSNSLLNGLQQALSHDWNKVKISSSVRNRTWEKVAQETYTLMQDCRN